MKEIIIYISLVFCVMYFFIFGGDQSKHQQPKTQLTQSQIDSILLDEYLKKEDSLDWCGQLEQSHQKFIQETENQKDSIISLNQKCHKKVSTNGENLIKKFETCQLKCYRIEGENTNTIGWGHKIKSTDPKWLRKLSIGQSISQSTADELFRQDMIEVNQNINYMLKTLPHNYVYTQGFIDGLGSLVYNCGMAGVMNTTFWNRLKNCRGDKHIINEDDLQFTLAAVKTTNITMNGHKNRRKEEYLMMLD